MKNLRMMILAGAAAAIASLPALSFGAEYMVYGVQRALDMGNAGEVAEKDFYVNMGTIQGIHPGSTLQIVRKMSTYDLVSQKLYKDMVFPIATLKVIHVENNAAIARLDKFMSPDKTPAVSPRAVMVGDMVRLPE